MDNQSKRKIKLSKRDFHLAKIKKFLSNIGKKLKIAKDSPNNKYLSKYTLKENKTIFEPQHNCEFCDNDSKHCMCGYDSD